MESGTNSGPSFAVLFRRIPAFGAFPLSAAATTAISDLLDHLWVAFLTETLWQPVVDEHRVERIDTVIEDDLAECAVLQTLTVDPLV